jgi:uncharacterized protein (UPF0548 family)
VCAVIVIVSVTTAWTCDARQTFGGRRHTSSGATGATVPPLKRKIQSWLIRNGYQSRISQRIKHSTKKNDTGRTKQRGSFMTSECPTKERLYRWFGVEGEDPNHLLRCMMLRNEFNHNVCGITNPFLKIHTSSKPQQEQQARDAVEGSTYSELDGNNRRILRPLSNVGAGNCEGNTGRFHKTVLTSRSNNFSAVVELGSSTSVENSWWPSLQITQNNNEEQDGNKKLTKKWRTFLRKNENSNVSGGAQNTGFREEDWRILKYRKRVGRGRDCYRKVRDAALDWEFQSADGSAGMIQVPDTSPSGGNFELETMPVASSNMKRSYSVEPIDDDESDSNRSANAYSSSSSLYRSLGSRRLVSFASKSVTEFLPSFLRRRIYSINPVMVVYDVMDQRAPDGQTTFTSTAYATLKGHFLCGEERVTVALRDGSQDVEVEILSISRAAPGLFGKILWPFIGKMQSNFFQQQLHHLSQSGLMIDVDDPIAEGDANNNAKNTGGTYLLR